MPGRLCLWALEIVCVVVVHNGSHWLGVVLGFIHPRGPGWLGWFSHRFGLGKVRFQWLVMIMIYERNNGCCIQTYIVLNDFKQLLHDDCSTKWLNNCLPLYLIGFATFFNSTMLTG